MASDLGDLLIRLQADMTQFSSVMTQVDVLLSKSESNANSWAKRFQAAVAQGNKSAKPLAAAFNTAFGQMRDSATDYIRAFEDALSIQSQMAGGAAAAVTPLDAALKRLLGAQGALDTQLGEGKISLDRYAEASANVQAKIVAVNRAIDTLRQKAAVSLAVSQGNADSSTPRLTRAAQTRATSLNQSAAGRVETLLYPTEGMKSAEDSAAAFSAAAREAYTAEARLAQSVAAGQAQWNAYAGALATSNKSARDSAAVFQELFAAEEAEAQAAAAASARKIQAWDAATKEREADAAMILAAEEAEAQAVERHSAELRQLLGVYAPLEAEAQRLAKDQKQLTAAFEAGELTLVQYNEASRNVQARQRAVTQEMGRQAKGAKLSAYQVQNLGYQFNDFFTQWFSGTPVSQILAQQGGQVVQAFGGVKELFASIVSPTGAAVAGILAVGGAITAVLMKGNQLATFSRQADIALRTMGDRAGWTADQITAMRQTLASKGNSSSEAQAMALSLAQNSQVSAAQAQQVAALAPDFGAATHQETAEAIKQLTAAVEQGYPAVTELQNRFKLFNDDEMKNIRTMAEHGDKAKMLDMVLPRLSQRMAGAQEQSMSAGAQAMLDFTNAFSTLMTQIAESDVVIAALRGIAAAFNTISGFMGNTGAEILSLKKELDDLNKMKVVVKTEFDKENIDRDIAALEERIRRLQVVAAGGGDQLTLKIPPAPQPGTSTTAAGQGNGISQAILDRIADYQKESAALYMVGAARDMALAKLKAEQEIREKGYSGASADAVQDLYQAQVKDKYAAASSELVRQLTEEVAASGEIASAYAVSEAAGLKMAAVLHAEEQARQGAISGAAAQRVAYLALAKAAQDVLAAENKVAAGYAAQLQRAGIVAQAARQGDAAKAAANDNAQVDEQHASGMAAVVASGDVALITAYVEKIKEAKTQAAALRALNNQESTNSDIAAQMQEVSLLQTKMNLIGMETDSQSEALAVAQARLEMQKRYGDELPEEARAYIENARQLALLNTEYERQNEAFEKQKKVFEELSGAIDQGFERIGSGITEMALEGASALDTMRNVGKASLSELYQEFFKLSTVNPLKNALLGGKEETIESVVSGLSSAVEKLFGGQTWDWSKMFASQATTGLSMTDFGIDIADVEDLSQSLGGSSAATELTTALTTTGATLSTGMGTAITTAGTTAATGMGTAITSAGATAAAQMYSSIVAAMATGSASSSGLGLFTSLAGSMTSGLSTSALGVDVSGIALAFASGGKVSGPGTGTSDSIRADLSNGEYVVNAASTRKYLPLLEQINSGKKVSLPGFAEGGVVSWPRIRLSSPSVSTQVAATTAAATETGSSWRGSSSVTQQTFNIRTNDADSFKRSKRQISRMAKQGLRA